MGLSSKYNHGRSWILYSRVLYFQLENRDEIGPLRGSQVDADKSRSTAFQFEIIGQKFRRSVFRHEFLINITNHVIEEEKKHSEYH